MLLKRYAGAAWPLITSIKSIDEGNYSINEVNNEIIDPARSQRVNGARRGGDENQSCNPLRRRRKQEKKKRNDNKEAAHTASVPFM